MATFRAPFDEVHDTAKPPDRYHAGWALARATEAVLAEELGPADDLSDLSTAWGQLAVETRQGDQIVVSTPTAEVAVPRVMVNLAAMRLGLPTDRIEATDMPIQVIDIGSPVLVVPVDGMDLVTQEPDPVDLSTIPGVEAEAAIVYTRTQQTPYVRLAGRVLVGDDRLTAVAAAAMHLVANLGVRATYPRTRVVGAVVGYEDQAAEITVQAKKAGHAPKIERVMAGGLARPTGSE